MTSIAPHALMAVLAALPGRPVDMLNGPLEPHGLMLTTVRKACEHLEAKGYAWRDGDVFRRTEMGERALDG